jgi:hypothetical protein
MSVTVIAERLDWTRSMSVVMSRRNLPRSREVLGMRWVAFPATGLALAAGPIARSKTGEHDPAIPRSMSFCDTCVAPRYSNGPASGRRNTGAEAFELEGMDPCYIDIDGFWSKDADIKSPESAPIAK